MEARKKIIFAACGVVALLGALLFRRRIRNEVRNMINGSYFTVDELCRSTTAAARGIDNTPSATARANMQALITNMLDPIRREYGAPITVTSGYRSAALNAAVGGAPNSQHMTGNAADLVGAANSKEQVVAIFRAALKVGGYDQLIIEHSGANRWVHVSWTPTGRRGQTLSYENGKYTAVTESNFTFFV